MIVLECQAGSTEAFEVLITRWQERLWRHAFRLTGREEAAWDVIQETWLAITQGIVRLQDATVFRRWAYTIVSRKAASWQRSRGRLERIEPLDADGNVLSQRKDASKRSPASNATALLREALEYLPSDRQVLLSLRHLEGFDVHEIAGILGIPEGTVKSRLHHAREELRHIVERIDR